jgi:hypothetical protein
MTVALPFSLTDAELGPASSLIVVDPDGVQYEVKTAGDAAYYLADAWCTTLRTLRERELVPYSPEVVIRTGEQRALVITDDLREESEIIDELLDDGDRPQVKPSEVSGQLYLYAVLSDTQAGRVAMIKKKNPTKRARAGKGLFAAGDELRQLAEDPWELDPLFDLVVSSAGGYALNTHYFEQLFADTDRLRAKIGPWIADIAKHLPMSAASSQLLAAECEASPRLRRRLRAIAHRGHISRVTLADVRRHAKTMGLPTTDFVRSNQLVVGGDLGELLRMLNEDLARGGLTGDPFRIESKEPLRS